MSYAPEDRRQRSSLVNSNSLDSKTNLFTAEDYIYRARLAEKALRFEDMLIQMRHVLDLKKKLTADERNLLVVAYKNAVTTRRTGVCVEFEYPRKIITLLLAIRHLSAHCKKLDEMKLSQVKSQSTKST